MPPLHPIDILLIDDDDADVMLIQDVMARDRIYVNLHRAEDGVEGLKFLRKQPPYTDAPTPDLIFLDLNMPRMNGLEVLSALKADDALKLIPVVVLTTSDRDQDIIESYRHQASCFVTKPVELGEFRKIVSTLQGFWLTVVRLPS
jgi:chemotaxis family two-component system response regulator Rcp1